MYTGRSVMWRTARSAVDILRRSMHGDEDSQLRHLVLGPIRAETARRKYTIAPLRARREEDSPGLQTQYTSDFSRGVDSQLRQSPLTRRRSSTGVMPSESDIFQRAKELQAASSSSMCDRDSRALGATRMTKHISWEWQCTGCGSTESWDRTTPRQEGYSSHAYLSLDRWYFRCSCGAWAINMKNKEGSSLVKDGTGKGSCEVWAEGKWPSHWTTCVVAAWAELLRELEGLDF